MNSEQRDEQPVGIVALDRFIRATRDSGYRGTDSAVAELVDNSIQAGAKNIDIGIGSAEPPGLPGELYVDLVDDGVGMESSTLVQALRFGGSSRFDDRSSLGRYGMGLPNASLSQARRVDIYTWTGRGKDAWHSYLDVDEIAQGRVVSVPEPTVTGWPEPNGVLSPPGSGTLVRWSRCDRLDYRRASTIARKLHRRLGRMFRYFLWSGVRITVNGEDVRPIDPLYLREPSNTTGGTPFMDPLTYEIRAAGGAGNRDTGIVTVRFSELPVQEWAGLPKAEKRRLGIAGGAGVSVVRAGREIEYGWLFLRGKRRENYDDWWRAEVSFEPLLDELFGITHTKQQIRPSADLLEVLGDDMVDIARALSGRARKAHLLSRNSLTSRQAEAVAARRERDLPRIGRQRLTATERALVAQVRQRYPAGASEGGPVYRIVEDDLDDGVFFEPVRDGDSITVLINPRHRFFDQFYRPLVEGNGNSDHGHLLQLILLAAARAEAAAPSAAERRAIRRFRSEWSTAIRALFRP